MRLSALVLAGALVVLVAAPSHSSVTIDLIFTPDAAGAPQTEGADNGPTGTADVIALDDGVGCSFGANSFSSGFCMNIVMTTDEALIGHALSLSFDVLPLLSTVEAVAALKFRPVATGMMTFLTPNGAPILIDNVTGSISSFRGTVQIGAPQQTLAPGTYRIGTVVWAPTLLIGTTTITPTVGAGEGFRRPDFSLVPEELLTLNTASLLVAAVIPEPATVLLLGLGLLGLASQRRL